MRRISGLDMRYRRRSATYRRLLTKIRVINRR